MLHELKRAGYRPNAWADLIVTSGRRSIGQIAQHPIAAIVGCWPSSPYPPRPARRAPFARLANVLALVRAGLPARAWVAPFALALGATDGLVARRRGPTAFGSFADPLADVAFWSAIALRRESGGAARVVTALLWTAPAVAVAVAYFAKGQAIDYPRWLFHRRLSAAAQVLLTVEVLRRSASGYRQ